MFLELSRRGALGAWSRWLEGATRLTSGGRSTLRGSPWAAAVRSASAVRRRRVRIIFVQLDVSSPLILEAVLEEARSAALAGGLTRVCRMHILVGNDAALTERELAAELYPRLGVPLFEGCEVTFESTDGDKVMLRSIEGVVPEATA